MKYIAQMLWCIIINTTIIHADSLPIFYQLKDSTYRRDIYPHDQSLVVDFLRYTEHVEPESQITYLRAVLKVFTNIAKGSQYITAHTFNYVLTHLTDVLAPRMRTIQYSHYMKDYTQHSLDMLDRLKVINRSILLNEFTHNFDAFKASPSAFLDTIAEQLTQAAQAELEVQQLRHALIMFLEMHLNKLIWAPEDQEETWDLVKISSEHLATLVERDILDDTAYLDDLYWTLVHRYCHFIDLTYEYLNQDLFTAIKQDIVANTALLFELEEQDKCLEKRVECMQTAVMYAEAKKRASMNGLM